MGAFISPNSFLSIPRCDNRAVGWDDSKGEALLNRAKKMDSCYVDSMENAKNAATVFQSIRIEVELGMAESPPILKTGV